MSVLELDRDRFSDEGEEPRQPDMLCEDCGFEWWGGWDDSPLDPPEALHPFCPACRGG